MATAACASDTVNKTAPATIPAPIPTGLPTATGSAAPASLPQLQTFPVPAGSRPQDVAPAADGTVWYTAQTPGLGARRVWRDSTDRVWVSEWSAGQVALYDPHDQSWREWKLAGAHPQAYAVYVDEHDKVWLTDFGANAIVRFDPVTEQFTSFGLTEPGASVRQLLGRPREVWGAESAADRLVVVRTGG